MRFNPHYLLLALTTAACTNQSEMQENTFPIAAEKPHELVTHGHTRIDPYYWLNQRDNQEVIDYLEAENAYANSELSHTESLQDKLFEEIKGRIKEDDVNVPYFRNGYWYFSRLEAGKNYPIYCRKKERLEAPEEILFNTNDFAKDHDYYSLTSILVSPDNKMAIFFTDSVGRRQYNMHFKNLETGEILPQTIFPTNGSAAWANDNTTVFYASADQQTLRSDRIWKYKVGSNTASAEEIYHEADETFSTYVYKAKSERFIFIYSGSTLTTEQQFLNADEPDATFKLLQARTRGLEYSAEDYGDEFYMVTNHAAKNFQLMRTPILSPGSSNWSTVIPHREAVRLEGAVYFKNHLVLEEREGGLTRLRVRDWSGNMDFYIPFNDPAYMAYTEINKDYNTPELRFGYSSMTTPNSIFSFNMNTRERQLLKQTEVIGGYNPAEYVSERIFITARDGAKVPVSMVYKKSLKSPNGNPTLLYGYGSYGASMDAYFSISRLSLLDRGFIFAIAHIRGGEEMGRHWYEDGKLMNKKNTFYDFIDCGLYLKEKGYTASDQLFAMGGSAGGLLMGAVINMRPDIWKGVVAAVPFVDVVTTMLDESIPLTTGEFDEWGNPASDKAFYDYMLSYSPYDQVSKQVYPHMLVTTGLHDSQVQYWEPAKWVAKLRSNAVGNQKIYLVTNMSAGHGGKSGRFNAIKDDALEFAFLLSLIGITS